MQAVLLTAPTCRVLAWNNYAVLVRRAAQFIEVCRRSKLTYM